MMTHTDNTANDQEIDNNIMRFPSPLHLHDLMIEHVQTIADVHVILHNIYINNNNNKIKKLE